MDITRDYEHDPEGQETWNLLDHNKRIKSPVAAIKSWIFSRIRILRRFKIRRPRRRLRCYCPRIPRPSRRAAAICFLVSLIPLTLVLVIVLTPKLFPSYATPPQHYQDLAKRCKPVHPVPGCANPLKENIFIASTIYDPTGELVSGKWGERVLSLITILGRENVYISIYSDDSGPKGREALKAFKQKIHARHTVTIEGDDNNNNDSPFSLVGLGANVTLPDGTQRIKQAAYQAELRNRALRPLDTFNKRRGGLGGQIDIIFDKVLFLDDVSFHPIDAAHLLFNTNLQPSSPTTAKSNQKPKADYLAACALSYSHPLQLSQNTRYTLRDTQGFAPSRFFFPFFPSSSSSPSTPRSDINSLSDAVYVKSCFGSMMAVQAGYLQNLSPERNTYLPVANHTIDPDSDSPLFSSSPHISGAEGDHHDDDDESSVTRFRYEPAEYYDASPACLFSADLAYSAARDRKEATQNHGIFMNPYIRVGAGAGDSLSDSEQVLEWLPLTMKYEVLLVPVFSFLNFLASISPNFGGNNNNNNPYREITPGQQFAEQVWDVSERKWQLVKNRNSRPGMFCGWRGMRVLKSSSKPPGGDNGRTEEGKKKSWVVVDLKVPPGYNDHQDGNGYGSWGSGSWGGYGNGYGNRNGVEELSGAWKDDWERLKRAKGGVDKISEEERDRFWEVS